MTKARLSAASSSRWVVNRALAAAVQQYWLVAFEPTSEDFGVFLSWNNDALFHIAVNADTLVIAFVLVRSHR
ncbi:MAG: hypothetical protein AAF528_12290 [Cyanobacteria bacterium P01_C01_bin.121]